MRIIHASYRNSQVILRRVSMWIRRVNGNEFHFAVSESADSKYYHTMCGEKIAKIYLWKQTTAEGAYIRCSICQKMENDKVKASLQKHKAGV